MTFPTPDPLHASANIAQLLVSNNTDEVGTPPYLSTVSTIKMSPLWTNARKLRLLVVQGGRPILVLADQAMFNL